MAIKDTKDAVRDALNITGDSDEWKRFKIELSERERTALAKEIIRQLQTQIFNYAGKGLINFVMKLFVIALIALAVYGYNHGWLK